MHNLYEVHLTVSNATPLEEFKTVCKTFGVKPVYLDLDCKLGFRKDLMTSQVLVADNLSEVILEVKKMLLTFPYAISRAKIETPLDNTKEPCKYYECHASTTGECPGLEHQGFRKSKNTLKKGTLMYTFRTRDLADFELKTFILQSHTNIKKVILERCVYDSNEKQDDDWIL